jgi:hypothetical protein
MTLKAIPVDVREALEAGVTAASLALASGCPRHELARRLYATWYAAPIAPSDAPPDLPDDLVAVLRAAHAGSERWEDGWVAEQAGRAGRVVARRREERRLLERSEYVVPDRPGIIASPGAALLAVARRDHVDPGAGWWYAHTPGWRLDGSERALVRLFWNVGAGEVATLVAALSSYLTSVEAPSLLKCAIDPDAYSRADAVVLYLTRESVDVLRDGLDEVYALASPVLRDGAPPLTLRVGRGLAASDDPGADESFGEHRCRLVAEGVLRAESPDQAADAVLERFREEGVPPDRPYLADEGRRLPWE